MSIIDTLREARIEAFKDAHRAIRSLLASVSILEEAIDGGGDCREVLKDVRRNLLDNARRNEVPRFYSALRNVDYIFEKVPPQLKGGMK